MIDQWGKYDLKSILDRQSVAVFNDKSGEAKSSSFQERLSLHPFKAITSHRQ